MGKCVGGIDRLKVATSDNYFKNWYDFDDAHKVKHLEMPGIDPGTSRMLSERSTI